MVLKKQNFENTCKVVKYLIEQQFKVRTEDGNIIAAYRVIQVRG